MNEEGIERAAIFLMSVGEDEAAEVFKYLGPREVQRIGAAMAKLQSVSREQVHNVLTTFCSEAQSEAPLGADSADYIRSVLQKALGEDKSANIIERILHGTDTAGIDGLKWMDAPSVAEMIKNEHPQIVATILVHLEIGRAHV